MVDTLVFAAAALMCLTGALGVVLARNPVHSALMLVMTLFGIAVQFVAQEAHFLAAVQVIVYAGAIVVLFLFVIMLLGVDRAQSLEMSFLPIQKWAALLFAAGSLAIIAALILAVGEPVTGAEAVGGSVGTTDDVRLLAHSLFSDNVYAFELTSLLLVIAVIGAVVLVRKPRKAETLPRRRGRCLMEITTGWYLVLGALLFVIGGTGLLIRRNPLVMLMCVELMLNGVNLSFVAFSRTLGDIGGQTVVFFVLVVAAAEVVVGLGLVVAILRRQPGATADDLSALKG